MKKGTMNIGGKVYVTEETELPQTMLKYYVKNPRVYSELIKEDGEYPGQAEIDAHMTSSERAKELKEKIKANGGLMNPVIVKKDDYSVLEGNTRLAAYRILSKQEPNNPLWKNMKCIILPGEITEDDINILLGNFHIKGTKDWDPYEQAGHLYRWRQESKLPIETMAKQLGLTKGVVENMINVYTFMKEHDDHNKSRWSYYEEYLKNKGVNVLRQENPNFDTIFVSQVVSEKIPSAQYVRKIGELGNLNNKERKKATEGIVSGEQSFVEAYETVAETGRFDDALKKVRKFKTNISDDSFEKQVIALDGTAKKDIIFDIKKIQKRLASILKKIGEENNE